MLFRRLHLQLTGLCALITIAILSGFTVLYLTVAEHTMKENSVLSFQNHYDTLRGSLEQQTLLTYPYLLRMEQNNDCMIFLWDNGIPLSFNSLESHAAYAQAAAEIYTDYCAQTAEGTLTEEPVYLPSWPSCKELALGISHVFEENISSSEKATALKKNRGLVLLVLSSNTALNDRLMRQRIIFFLLSCAGCLLLTLFSYIFTGRMLKPLQENNEKQLAFISGASHELRTPLAVILSSVTARPPQYEETVKTEVLRMNRLIDELMLLSQPSYQFAPLEPDTFLLNFYEQLEAYVLSRNRSFSFHMPEESFPKICADKDKLRQLMEILLQNAISYTGEGGRICLSLSCENRTNRVCFALSDNGIGIPDPEKTKIFERFYRVDSARFAKEHFGLGLSIAKEIVTAHKGRITVSDTPGGGCTFRCFFPAD